MPEDHAQKPSAALENATNYPLYVVTARADDELSGCLAGFVTQCSMDPVHFLICISKINHTFGVAQKAVGFGLHLLGADQRDMASLFGEQTGDVVDKFATVEWSQGVTGAPILSECAAWIEGRVIGRMSGGDHEAFLTEVVAGGTGADAGRFMLTDATDFEPGHPE